jgi:acetyl-CoA carboxylase carboxyltransferase component
MRRLLDFLPASNEKGTMPIKKITDPGDRLVPEIDRLVPDDPNTPYDMKDVIRRVVDHGELFEIMPVRRLQMTSHNAAYRIVPSSWLCCISFAFCC